MARLTIETEEGRRWYPVPVRGLDRLLNKVIIRGQGFRNVYALRRNIAYNLQYLEYVAKCLEGLELSEVIYTQNVKMFIVVGCGIVESLLHFLLIKKDLHAKTEWELELIAGGNPKASGEETIKVDSHIYHKLSKPILADMTFDSMLQKAEKRKVLGSDSNVYPRLNYLRRLRNRVHLQVVDHPTDTDWNSFNYDDLRAMAQVLHMIFTGGIFRPSEEEKAYFSYLEEFLDN